MLPVNGLSFRVPQQPCSAHWFQWYDDQPGLHHALQCHLSANYRSTSEKTRKHIHYKHPHFSVKTNSDNLSESITFSPTSR